ncbi:molybdopterin-dependent oxidoreductase [Chloroflexota bacterium]
MRIRLTINGESKELQVSPHDRLAQVLRREGYFSVKFGDEKGMSGASTVLLDGKPVNSIVMLAAQADGHRVTTVEALGTAQHMHPLQQAFIDTGAIQSGYNTPAQLLVAKALLDENPQPTEAEVREALAGVLDRETGYVKPVQAVLRAAAMMRGESVEPFIPLERAIPLPEEFFTYPADDGDSGDAAAGPVVQTITRPVVVVTPPDVKPRQVIGQPEPKVDAVKLALGRPVFADDFEMRGLLHAAMLTSPHAHARVTAIDTSAAETLPGVHAVLTYKNVRRVKYASGGQSYPNPLPYDQVSLDDKVRHIGDRVAVVAAETPEIARAALRLIDVQYEILPAIFDPEAAMQPGAVVIHDEADTEGIFDRERNIVHRIEASEGDAEAQWAKAERVFEGEYRVHQVQQAHIEPHVCVTYWDEDDRLVVRTSTQVPFHVRRMLSPLLDLPVKRIRVIKPRIGGGFGGKQEMLVEDLAGLLTIATGRPVRFEYTREQEFTSSRSRHPQVLHFKTGVTNDGEVVAAELYLIGNTGAYGTHGLTVQMVTGFRALSTYNAPYSKFVCDVVYTNIPTPGAYRGYGAPQGLFALEVHMEEIAEALGLDVVEFKRRNWIKLGDSMVMARALGEGREGFDQIVKTTALAEAVDIGLRAMQWDKKRNNPGDGPVKRGLGLAVAMHGSGIAGLDMGAASIKINDDGSFNLAVGATDLGTGSDTVLAQIAAEVLGVPLQDIIIYSSDTDFTPFDTGAYASSTTYISGGAVFKAALDVRQQICDHAAAHLLEDVAAADLDLMDGQVVAPDGRAVSLEKVALHSLHQAAQKQIAATASHMSYESPPPFAAQFAEVLVDTETGQVTVERLLMVVDCGMALNPITASGQVEGGMVQALGYAHCEEMAYDADGRVVNPQFDGYKIYRANEMPELEVVFVETYEPSGPFGAKAVAEIPKDGVAPALASAIHDATGVWIRELPYTPERVWQALQDVH